LRKELLESSWKKNQITLSYHTQDFYRHISDKFTDDFTATLAFDMTLKCVNPHKTLWVNWINSCANSKLITDYVLNNKFSLLTNLNTVFTFPKQSNFSYNACTRTEKHLKFLDNFKNFFALCH